MDEKLGTPTQMGVFHKKTAFEIESEGSGNVYEN
jgi:hypothetical protein